MAVKAGGNREFSDLVHALEHGKMLDVTVDKKSKDATLVARSKSLAVWKYVYRSDDYAFTALTQIRIQAQASTTDEQKKELQHLADAVMAAHRNLTKQSKSNKKSGVVAKCSRICHSLSKKQTHTSHDVRIAYADVLRATGMQETFPAMGKKVESSDSSAIAAHRTPATDLYDRYSDQTNITACQTRYAAELLSTAPRDWQLPGDSFESRKAVLFLEELSLKLCTRAVYDASVEAFLEEHPDEVIDIKSMLFELARKRDISTSVLAKLPLRDVMKMVDDTNPTKQKISAIVTRKAEAAVKEKLQVVMRTPLSHTLQSLASNDPIQVIVRAHVKEVAARMAYRQDLPGKIAEGNYNPAVMAQEIKAVLGVTVDFVPPNMKTIGDVKQELKLELSRVGQKAELSESQMRYVRHDVYEILDLYVAAYPNKTIEQQYILARDVLRVIVYQELFDKGSFTGSDHGSKHVHHNCANADGLHEHMHASDYTAKDRFLEHFIHAYHDTGYTVGLAAANFACCKDHPFIGAKMIEENREYFVALLDESSVEVLHDSILCHAIALPDLTPDQEMRDGIHPNLVRAVTSISDACAVTYDRKTQEFWEQPEALIALTRLKLFLTQYPRYKSVLSNPQIIQNEWAGLDDKNPLDILAHDIFQGTKESLLQAADNYPLAPDRRELFKQAIRSQFNAFTANVTIGQYGAVLTGIQSVSNEDAGFGDPKYLPQFNMAPSIIYGVLRDLFGQDQAQEAFKKLLSEFGGDISDISDDITQMAEAIAEQRKVASTPKRSGVAFFNIQPVFDVFLPIKEKDKAHKKHLEVLQQGLVDVTREVGAIYQKSPIDVKTKAEIIQELQRIKNGESQKSLQTFLDELTARPKRYTPQQKSFLREFYSKAVQFDRVIESFRSGEHEDKENERLFSDLQDAIIMCFISDEEYAFMVKDVKNKRDKTEIATV